MQLKVKSLFRAAKRGNTEEVKRLLDDKVDVNGVYSFTYGSALHIACEKRRIDVINLLLSIPELDVNQINSAGETALIKACEKGHSKVVRQLLAVQNINLNIVSKYGDAAIHIACKRKHHKILKILLSHEQINASLADGYGRTILHIAVVTPGLHVHHVLLPAAKINVNAQDIHGMTALHIACQKGKNKVINELLQIDNISIGQLDNYGNVAFDYAETYTMKDPILSDEETLSRLLHIKNLDINHQYNSHDKSLLHWCAENGFVSLLPQIISLKGKINLKDIYGRTPLHLACYNQQHNVITALINAGATVFIKDNKCRFRIGVGAKIRFFDSVYDQYPGEMIPDDCKTPELTVLRDLTRTVKCIKLDIRCATKTLQAALITNEKITTDILGRLLRNEEGIKLDFEHLVSLLRVVVLSQLATEHNFSVFCQNIAIEYYGIMTLYSGYQSFAEDQTHKHEAENSSKFERHLRIGVNTDHAKILQYMIIALLCVGGSDLQANKILGMTLLAVVRPVNDALSLTLENILIEINVNEKIEIVESILSMFEDSLYIEVLKAQLIGWLDITSDRESINSPEVAAH